MQPSEIIEINNSRIAELKKPYNQILGIGSPIPRKKVYIEEIGEVYLPYEIFYVEWVKQLVHVQSISDFLISINREPTNNNIKEVEELFVRERLKVDFEFFAATCARIKDKITGLDVPLFLNKPQLKLLTEFERQRLSQKPIRIILLKARQWGGSTLTQIYMAWIQLFRKRGWNSVIAAHIKDASSNVKGMYQKLLENLPYYAFDEIPKFTSYQRMSSTSIIKSRECKLTVGTAEKPDSLRSQDIIMAHLTEVAIWPDTKEKKSADLIRSITSPISLVPESIIVLESTANGVGDYFHTEYLRAKKGESDKEALFVAWFEAGIYSLPIKKEDIKDFAESLDDYELNMFNLGATLQNIKWYREKRKEYPTIQDMQAEFPSTDIEAFTFSGEKVFQTEHIEKLRIHNRAPIITGEIISFSNPTLDQTKNGLLYIWEYPGERLKNRYVVTVDVGGRSAIADYSVITVFDKKPRIIGNIPNVVAQWAGHIDHDLLVWKAASISKYYHKALLVIESNTLETENTDGDHTSYILEQLAGKYSELYYRSDPESIRQGLPPKWGFHTNRSTKTLILDYMIEILRDGGYDEPDQITCDEYDTYEKKKNGSFGAIDGRHDDRLMTRLIGMYVSMTTDIPKEYTTPKNLGRNCGMAAF